MSAFTRTPDPALVELVKQTENPNAGRIAVSDTHLLPPPVKELTKEERRAQLQQVDDRLRRKATKAVEAAMRYAEVKRAGVKPDDMTEEEYQMALDAGENDKNTPWGLKLHADIFKSYQKQSEEQAVPPLALQINFFGDKRPEYPEIVIDRSKE